MGDYEEYIKKVKGIGSAIDYDRMYAGIQQRRRNAVLVKVGMSLAGAVAGFLIAFAVYFSLYQAGNGREVIAYLHEGGSINGSPLLAYVFED